MEATPLQLSVAVGGVNVTVAEQAPLVTTGAPQVMDGPVISCTVMVSAAVELLPQASVAVQVRVTE